jgi:hypothetical protein
MDEPVPKCLFAPPRFDLVRVPACRDCNNNKKSIDDSFLRDMLALNQVILTHSDGPFIFNAFVRSAQKGTSVVDRIVRKYGEIAKDPRTGLYLPHRISVPFSRDRIIRVFKWIARGLYFHWHEHVLRDDYLYHCALTSRAEAEHRENGFREMGLEPKWSIGNRGQFRYFHVRFEDPHITFWQMVFYECEFFIISSTPPGMSRDEFEQRYGP